MSLISQFEKILTNPRIYNATGGNQKPNYVLNAAVQCDRCGESKLETFVSSLATPQVDLCTTCFNKLQASFSGGEPVVGQPTHYRPAAQFPCTGTPGARSGVKSMSINHSIAQSQRENVFGSIDQSEE